MAAAKKKPVGLGSTQNQEHGAPHPPLSFYENAGLVIRKQRTWLGLTRSELAQRAGLSRRHLDDIETGRKKTSLFLAARICSILGLQIQELSEPWQTSGDGDPSLIKPPALRGLAAKR